MDSLMARLSRRVPLARRERCCSGGLCCSAGLGRASSCAGASVISSGQGQPVACESQVPAAGRGDDLGGCGEEAEPEAARLPPADFAGQAEHGHPGQEIEGDLDDLQPDLVMRGVVQGQVVQTDGADGAVRFSALARWPCRSSSVAIGTPVVLVAHAVSRRLSASVKCNWALRWGRSLRTISRIPFAPSFRQPPDCSATQRRRASRRPARRPPSMRRSGPEHGLVDGVGDGYADRIRQPLSSLREPGDGLVGVVAGVGTDQRLAPAPVLLRSVDPGQVEPW